MNKLNCTQCIHSSFIIKFDKLYVTLTTGRHQILKKKLFYSSLKNPLAKVTVATYSSKEWWLVLFGGGNFVIHGSWLQHRDGVLKNPVSMTEPCGLVDWPVTEQLELSLALHFSAKAVATLGLKGAGILHDVTSIRQARKWRENRSRWTGGCSILSLLMFVLQLAPAPSWAAVLEPNLQINETDS